MRKHYQREARTLRVHEAQPANTECAFVLSRIPAHRPLRGNGLMAKVVNRLLRQVGISAPCSGAYVGVHTPATTMVRVEPVPKSRRHHRAWFARTTGIYAKLDPPSVAQSGKPQNRAATVMERSSEASGDTKGEALG